MTLRDIVVLPIPHPLAARTATTQSERIEVGRFVELIALLNITAVSGTSPTLDIKAQASDDGSDWYDFNPASAFTQKTATGKDMLKLTNFGRFIRFIHTIAGTSPSFTFELKLMAKT
jgi:hypothetical protein